jgi:hypothetical protein
MARKTIRGYSSGVEAIVPVIWQNERRECAVGVCSGAQRAAQTCGLQRGRVVRFFRPEMEAWLTSGRPCSSIDAICQSRPMAEQMNFADSFPQPATDGTLCLCSRSAI